METLPPLVGHNCIFNWDLVRSLFPNDALEYPVEYWGENFVSEDFSMALNLHASGYFGKYIFTDYGFKEGVTLNVIDEISKFSKYAYGVSEIMFYPFMEWRQHGIFSDLFKRLIVTKNIPIFVKFSIISYLGIYYAMALSPIITIINYFMYQYNELYQIWIDRVIENIIIGVLLFFVLTPISNIVVRNRHGLPSNSLGFIIKNEAYYCFHLLIFFGGMQYHFLKAIFIHMCSIPMGWSTTNKKLIKLNILTRLQSFYLMYIFCFLLTCMIVVLYYTNIVIATYSIVPLSATIGFHIIMPLVL